MAVTPARIGTLRLNAGRLNLVAPQVPHTPTPPHLSLAGPQSVQWLGYGNTWDVYFGTTATPPLVGTTPNHAWVLPPLTFGVVYFWKVVAKANALGPEAAGPVWSFTAANPSAPIYISPAHHAINQPTQVTLTWSQPAQEAGITFDVYFGPTPSPPLVQRRQTALTYTTGLLKDGVDYYWRIVAINNGGTASGPIWTFEVRNPTKGLITIGGVDVRARVRIAGISIRDLLADTPNTATFTIEGAAPTIGKEVRIGLASLAGDDVIFGGYIDTVEALYEGRPENRAWRITAQDYTYGMNRRKVRTRYTQQSATTIAQNLLTFAPAGYTGTNIVAGLPIVSGGIDFTDEDVTTRFARLAARIGGYWYVDYAKDVHLFLTEATAAPTPITRAARVLLAEPPIHWSTDLSQIRTRVFVEGGGSQARQLVAVGATTLPVTDASWYSPTGGLVVSGPQRIRYAGKGTVGGPAKPTATGQSVVGNLGGGPYSYVVTQITAGAESPLSPPSTPVLLPAVTAPPSTITVATSFSGVAVPQTAAVVTPFLSGVAAPVTTPTITWVSTHVPAPASGPGGLTPVTTQVAAPASAPTAAPITTQVTAPAGPGNLAAALPMTGVITGYPTFSGSRIVDVGTGTAHVGSSHAYYYQATYINGQGETTGPGSAQTAIPNSGSSPCNFEVTINAAPAGQGITGITLYRFSSNNPNGGYRKVVSLSASGGIYKDTQPYGAIAAAPLIPTVNTTGTPGAGGLPPGNYYYRLTFVTAAGETTGSAESGIGLSNASPFYTAVQLSNIPTSPDGRVTARRIYRAAGGTYKLEAQLSDNSTTTYLSAKPDAQLGAQLVDTNTTGTGKLVKGASYGWVVTFGTSSGETTNGPSNWQVALNSTQDMANLSGIPTSPDGRVTKRHLYRTVANGAGSVYRLEATLNDNVTTTYQSGSVPDASLGAALTGSNTTGSGKLVLGGFYAWLVTFVTAQGETTQSPHTQVSLPASADTVDLSSIPTSADGRVTKRKLYRTPNGGGAFKLEATINDNTTTTFRSGAIADASLGAGPPTVNTSGNGGLVPGTPHQWAVTFVTGAGETPRGPNNNLWEPVPAGYDQAYLSDIPLGAAQVISRRLYRSAWAGTDWGPYLLVATINDNVTTAYLDTKTTAQLGAQAPSNNSTGGGGLVPGVQYGWTYTYVTAAGETTTGSGTGWVPMPANCDMAALSAIPTSPDARVTKRKLYRVSSSSGVWQLEATINDNTTTTFTSVKTDGALGAIGLPPANTTGTGGLTPSGYYAWAVKYVTATGESDAANPWADAGLPAEADTATLSSIPVSADARVTKRRIYRTAAGGGTFKFEQEIADNVTTTVQSTKADSALGAAMIAGNTTSAGGQIAVSGIAVGGGTTTARKLYRTESGGAAYKLVTVINENTSTTYQDNKADGSLGALAPVDEITELIGIPASGMESVRFEIRLGDDVNLLVQCDDTAAQTALGALEGGGSQGIVEHVLQDRRLALPTATATGNADLALFARPLITIQYATRDPKTRSGKSVRIDLPELSLVGDFTIQAVEIDEIDLHPGLHPKYRVTCSSVRFSFEDAVRRFRLDGTE